MRGQELLTLVVYDVENDRTRLRVMNTCKDYGLEHIQYSAFWGFLDSPRRTELFVRLADTLGGERGRILLVPICEKDVQARRVVINES